MDPVTIATGAATLLVPYVKKAAEEFAGEAGTAVLQKVGHLLTRIRDRLFGDAAARDTVDRFEQSPERYRPYFEDVLKEKLAADGAFRAEIESLLQAIEQTGPQVAVVQRMKKAEGVIGVEARELARGRVTVDQKVEDAKEITGAKFDRIGG
jgi:hypothetical protein